VTTTPPTAGIPPRTDQRGTNPANFGTTRRLHLVDARLPLRRGGVVRQPVIDHCSYLNPPLAANRRR